MIKEYLRDPNLDIPGMTAGESTLGQILALVNMGWGRIWRITQLNFTIV